MKKVLSVLLALGMVLCSCACANSNGAGSNENTHVTTTTTTEGVTSAWNEEDESATSTTSSTTGTVSEATTITTKKANASTSKTTKTTKKSTTTTKKPMTTTKKATTTVSNNDTTNTTTKPNTNSTTSSTTTNPSTSNSTTSNNNSSSDNTNNNSNWLDGYVYKDPTVYVNGMYTLNNIDSKPDGIKLRMGELYVDRERVAEIHRYIDRNGKLTEFDTSHIVTDVNKMPSNYQLYPYIIDTIPNWLYEKNITVETCKNLRPIEAYYNDFPLGQYQVTIRGFYRTIGDIDYNSIDVQKMHDSLKLGIADPYNTDPINMDKLTEYVSYVKQNKIKSTADAEVLLPIVYSRDGYGVMVRTKVTVNVESSNTNNIKLFLHDNLTLKKEKMCFILMFHCFLHICLALMLR